MQKECTPNKQQPRPGGYKSSAQKKNSSAAPKGASVAKSKKSTYRKQGR